VVGRAPAARAAAAHVEEVLQKTFLAVWKGANGYRPRGMPQAWLI
jgi:DNA-directed RNA polymerase specialized sigma24 family protein